MPAAGHLDAALKIDESEFMDQLDVGSRSEPSLGGVRVARIEAGGVPLPDLDVVVARRTAGNIRGRWLGDRE
jgi:hypothetical protein